MKKLSVLTLVFAAIIGAHASEPFNGLLIDLKGNPINGAKIYVHNPKQYAKSDKQGRFGLTDVKGEDTIHVLIKKQTYAIPVNGSKGMRITIGDVTPKAVEDQELIAMGTGYVKKREYLGPRSGITGEQLAATGESDFIKAMRGMIPGVNVIETDKGPNLSVRNSISANTRTLPLWIVDGSQSIDPPSLTVNEIESVEVLKDGAMYGSRGANGVIIVKLKSK